MMSPALLMRSITTVRLCHRKSRRLNHEVLILIGLGNGVLKLILQVVIKAAAGHIACPALVGGLIVVAEHVVRSGQDVADGDKAASVQEAGAADRRAVECR